MALVWVLFGSECDYYKGLRNVYATLELKEVMAQKMAFTAEHCRRITWAIIDDGRAHFDDVKTTLDFRGSDEPVYPQSFLVYILRNVHYAITVERANFPDEWKRKVCPTTDDGGGTNTGGGALQMRGRERPLPQGMAQGPNTQRRDLGHTQGYTGGGGQPPFGTGQHGGWWPPYQGGGYQSTQYPQAGGQQGLRD